MFSPLSSVISRKIVYLQAYVILQYHKFLCYVSVLCRFGHSFSGVLQLWEDIFAAFSLKLCFNHNKNQFQLILSLDIQRQENHFMSCKNRFDGMVSQI